MKMFPLYIEAEKEMKKYLNYLGIADHEINLDKLFYQYFYIKAKIIEDKPRKVLWASHLKAKILTSEPSYIQKIEKIQNIIEEGKPVNKYLSLDSLQPNSHDLLLFEWGIHHLHLENKPRKKDKRFTKRSQLLLFTIFDNESCYFVDIGEHYFAKKEWLRIIYENWGDLNGKFIVEKSLENEIDNLSEKQINEYRNRKIGLTYTTIVNGCKFYPINGGCSISGNSGHAIRCADKLHRQLYDIQNELDSNIELIKANLQTKYKLKYINLLFKVQLNTDGKFYIYESNTGCSNFF